MEWFRFYNEVRVDRKLDTLTGEQYRTWVNLMCYAAEQETRGTIPPMNTEKLAIECAKGDEELLTSTLNRLISPLEIIERLEDDSLHFINWEKRQPNSDSSTERSRKSRQRSCNGDATVMQQECNGFSSVSVSSSSLREGDARGRDEYTPEFESFWKLYPHRKGNSKRDAFAKWKATLNKGATVDDLLRAVTNYAHERDGKDDQYTMMAATFLGPGERWRAYLAEEKPHIVQYEDPTEKYREEWADAGGNR